MLKRIFLFVLTNLLVMVTVGIVLLLISHFFGGHGQESYYPTHYGYAYGSYGLGSLRSASNYWGLLGVCFVWGMVGAFISLAMSKFIAKHFMGVRIIDLNSGSERERQLVRMIHRLAQRSGLSKMPEVGIYDSMEINAFATGPSKRRSLVAVSSGLMQRMNEDELEGVLGHEISHIANGDMVTMTLIQGVVNAFAMFLARVLASIISTAMSSNQREEGGGGSFWVYFLLTTVFQILFTLLGSLIVAAFSRWREYRADAGGARLSGKSKMIAALEKLKMVSNVDAEDQRAPSLAALKISKKGGTAWWSSHPSLDDRIARLRSART